MNDESDVYQYLVVDSGPIIRLTGASTLWKKAKHFFTVPAVIQEIRDAKARHHLENLPFELHEREPSPEGTQAVVDFARQTGDYQSLSSVDLQVLALLYDMESEGCHGDMSHVRKTPKRTVGLGKMEILGKEAPRKTEAAETSSKEHKLDSTKTSTSGEVLPAAVALATVAPKPATSSAPKSWASMAGGARNSSSQATESTMEAVSVSTQAVAMPFGKMTVSDSGKCGQFSDADEESDVSDDDSSIDGGLDAEFPSLSASARVSREGSEDEAPKDATAAAQQDDQDAKDDDSVGRKKAALAPISKSGKLWNTLGRYKGLTKPTPAKKKVAPEPEPEEANPSDIAVDTVEPIKKNQSRIIGGVTLSGQDLEVEDDGEGWIINTNEIKTMKAAGVLDPLRTPNDLGRVKANEDCGPPLSVRAACTTTDFAMQNVILQMGLELLSVDGMKVRKLKSWVTRCGACFKIYTNTDDPGMLDRRLFCDRCGSDFVQRVAASVDGKTGRLRLHMKKNYQHNLRGTKFSLPKAGTGNRFQGDLLLREDQLMMGAWNQKVKMRSGGKANSAAQSIFGNGIASDVGCNTRSLTTGDIRVGFGKKNPNSAKGRERRGKKKKSKDKACGLRRY